MEDILKLYAEDLQRLEDHELINELKYQYGRYIELWGVCTVTVHLAIFHDEQNTDDRKLVAAYLPLIIAELERRIIP